MHFTSIKYPAKLHLVHDFLTFAPLYLIDLQLDQFATLGIVQVSTLLPIPVISSVLPHIEFMLEQKTRFPTNLYFGLRSVWKSALQLSNAPPKQYFAVFSENTAFFEKIE